MKKQWYWGLFVLAIVSCQNQENEDEPVADLRDTYVGTYRCEVEKKIFTTDQVLSQYVDTIMVTKLGEDQLVVNQLQELPTLEVKLLIPGHFQFTTPGTIVTFPSNGRIELVHGPDTAFYEIVGNILP